MWGERLTWDQETLPVAVPADQEAWALSLRDIAGVAGHWKTRGGICLVQ